MRTIYEETSDHERVIKLERRLAELVAAVDVISARLADVQTHPSLSIPPLPGFEAK